MKAVREVEATAREPRLVGVSRGDPWDPHAVSGVARHLFDALERRYAMVARIDTSLRSWQRRVVAVATFHPRRPLWRERFYKNRLAFTLQSRNTQSALAGISERFDLVVQIHALFRTLGAPYVVEIDTTHELTRKGWPPWSPFSERQVKRWYALERRTYHSAAHLFVRSTPVAESLVHFYGVPREHVTVVGGGAHFYPLPPPVTAVRESTILFVGRDYQRKGGDRLIEAFRTVRARLPSARLQIVGTLEAPAEAGVEVLGPIGDRQRLADLYSRAAVFCLPSRFEPYGLALCEAMAYGLPCVATRSGAFPEIVVDGKTGLLVPPGDTQALANALVRLLEDADYASNLGEAGRRRVEEYLNWDRVVDRMAPVLERLAERGGEVTDSG